MANDGQPEFFPPTQWSLVGRAGRGDAAVRREALGTLLGRYLAPLRAHLVRRRSLPPERAEDLVQDFIAGKILERELLARADKDLGKFRTFLLTALDRFVSNKLRDGAAKKRSPAGAMLAFDERVEALAAQPADDFDRDWAAQVVREALRLMRSECEAARQADIWGVFASRIVRPMLEGAEPVEYGELIRRFGFQSPSQASNALMTAKRKYGRALRAVIAEYARDEAEIEAELRELRAVLAKG